MVGVRPSGFSARMSASASKNETVAAWEAELRRQQQVRGVTIAAAIPASDRPAAAHRAPHDSGEEPPQLNNYLPGSQAVDHLGTTLSSTHTAIFTPYFEPVNVPGAGGAAEGVPARDCVDNRGRGAFRGPPAPPPAGAVQHGSQTVWNLESGLRPAGDAGLMTQQQRAPLGADGLVTFDNTSADITPAPLSSTERPTAMPSTQDLAQGLLPDVPSAAGLPWTACPAPSAGRAY